jgi:chromosome segregation ATPase
MTMKDVVNKFCNTQEKSDDKPAPNFEKMIFEFLHSNASYLDFVRVVWREAQEDCALKYEDNINEFQSNLREYQKLNQKKNETIADLERKVEISHTAATYWQTEYNKSEVHNGDLREWAQGWAKARDIWMQKSEVLEKKVQELEGANAMLKDINDQLADRIEKQERDLEDLGKTLRYREDLNIGLANKLKKAHQERNKLQEILEKQEATNDTADALERMLDSQRKNRNLTTFPPR